MVAAVGNGPFMVIISATCALVLTMWLYLGTAIFPLIRYSIEMDIDLRAVHGAFLRLVGSVLSRCVQYTFIG